MAAARKRPTSTSLEVDTTLPRIAQAFSIGLAVLKFAKKTTWAELSGKGPDGLAFDENGSQLELIADHLDELALIRFGPPKSPVKTTAIAVCPVCERWAFAGDTIAASCNMTLDCPGKPAKVSPAKATTVEVDEHGKPIAAPDAPPTAAAEQLPAVDPLHAEVILGRLPAASTAGSEPDPGLPVDEPSDAPADYSAADDWSHSPAPDPSDLPPSERGLREDDAPWGYDPADDWADSSPATGDGDQQRDADDVDPPTSARGTPVQAPAEQMDAATLLLMMEEYG